MGRATKRWRPAHAPAAVDLEAELAGIATMNVDELRDMWRQRRGNEPPTPITKDLIARALAHWLQEERFGGLSPQLRKLLGSRSKMAGATVRHVKIGSIIVREYEGKLHEVLVVPDGFCWQGQIVASLSTIARKITGTSWNGPRFFGLRGVEEPKASAIAIPQLASSDREPLVRSRTVKARTSARSSTGSGRGLGGPA
jgi:hypothetical protein